MKSDICYQIRGFNANNYDKRFYMNLYNLPFLNGI